MPGNDKEEQIDQLIVLQTDTFDRLKKELVNFGKDGQDRKTKNHFQNRISRINELRNQFTNRHMQILNLGINDDNDYVENDQLGQFENKYIHMISFIQNKYDILYPANSLPVSPTAVPTTSQATNQPIIQPAPNVNIVQAPFKVPTAEVPKFTGIYTEWPSFYDSFLQVHTHEQLSKNHKFQILRGALSTNVKTLIGYLDITNDNYDTALEALVDRYNNKRVLFSNYMELFLNQENVSNENSMQLQSLYDVSRACLFEIAKLGIPIKECGSIFAHILLKKLPSQTRYEWEKEFAKTKEIPTFDSLVQFIDERTRTLEAVQPQSFNGVPKYHSHDLAKPKPVNQSSFKHNNRRDTNSFHVSSKPISCPMCKKPHILRKCSNFLKLSVSERKIEVEKLGVCTNCLGHSVTQACTSTNTCKICANQHHTLLLFNGPVALNTSFNSTSNSTVNTISPASSSVNTVASTNLINTHSNVVLLSTALVDVIDSSGQRIRLRALVDQGSQHSIVTERTAQRLRLPIIPICVGVRPMGETHYKIVNRGLELNIHSITSPEFSVESTLAIVPSITSDLPIYPLKIKDLVYLKTLPLADPHYATPGQIDMLLAGDVYGKIIQSGLCKGNIGEPIAQCTLLGWILFGEIHSQNHLVATPVNCFHVSVQEIGECMQKFYEIEEVASTRTLSKEDAWCEEFYEKTYKHHPNGKFILRLPLKSYFDPTAQIGASYATALKRFHSLHRKFKQNPKFCESYTKAINEYKQLNQMKPIPTIDDSQITNESKHFYLPHHAVIKESSITTKIRPVFDASAKSSNGKSLNDILTTGPALQADLISILLNWRCHKFVFISDVGKMYPYIPTTQTII